MIKHNKKRNIGLLTEFFSRYIANAFIDHDFQKIEKAKKIWKKYFVNESEMKKELLLYNSLFETNLKDRNIAHSLLQEIKKECKKQDQNKLDAEKSALINEIQVYFEDTDFFNRTVPNYKEHATIQVLLNAWRGIGFKGTKADLAKLEESVLEHLISEKKKENVNIDNVSTNDVDNLVVEIMNKKINEKYDDSLNEDQKAILKNFVFAKNDSTSKDNLIQILKTLKEESIKQIDKNILTETKINNDVKNQLKELKEKILNEKYSNFENLNEDTVVFYMSLAKLKEELNS